MGIQGRISGQESRARFKLCRVNEARLLTFIGGGLVAFFLICVFCPIVEEPVDAQDVSTQAEGASAAISVALDANVIDLDLVPTPGGAVTMRSAKLTVSTDNDSGYSLYLSTDGETQDLSDSAHAETIAPLPGAATIQDFPVNTWGYSLAAAEAEPVGEFQAVPANAESAILKIETAALDTYRFDVAAKVNTEIPAGTYSNRVIISAIANPELVKSLADLTFMQEMTTDICARSEIGDTAQLIDSRDGKSYWVAKLSNSREDRANCWMTQNLSLVFGTGSSKGQVTWLNPDDSDVSQRWGINVGAYPTQPTETTLSPIEDTSMPRSWYFGEIALGLPELSKSCGTSLSDYNCLVAGFLNVGGWSPTFEARPGIYNGPLSNNGMNTYITFDYEAKEYDAHYLLGTYYDWSTATAGSGKSAGTLKDASESICPKGWGLISGSNSVSGNLKDMLMPYLSGGSTIYVKGHTISEQEREIYNLPQEQTNFNAVMKPLYFVRGGSVMAQTGKMDYPGWFASYQAAQKYYVDLPGSSMNYYFDATQLKWSSTNAWYGMPVRCVAR